MNKKGFLLGEETVKIILAVIAILFLVIFIVYLYNSYSGSKDLTQAKASLTHLIDDINSGSTQEIIYNPSGWLIASFPEIIGGTYPIGGSKYYSATLKQCTSNKWAHCLCLCPAATSPPGPDGKMQIESVDSIVTSCESKAVCQESDFNINYFDSGLNHQEWNAYLMDPMPFTLSINQQTKTISIATNGP